MDEFLLVILFSLLPALGTFAGGNLAEFFKISRQTYSLALHAATGIMFAVISVVLIPQALKISTRDSYISICFRGHFLRYNR